MVSRGHVTKPDFTLYPSEFGAVFTDQRDANGHFGELALRFVDGKIILKWTGGADVYLRYYNHGSKESDYGYFTSIHSYAGHYDLSPGADGVIRFEFKDKVYTSSMGTRSFDNGEFAEYVLQNSGYKNFLDNQLVPEVTEGFERLDTEIDTFLLNNLLFQGTQVFHTESVHVPGPLVILGQLNPDLTTFQIDPVETIVGEGRSFKFQTTDADVPVTWSVANLPDGSGNAGVIDPDTGVYTAPARTDLPDNQKRVIVTAKAKTGSAVSQALVGIVSRDIGLDPIVLMANKGRTATRSAPHRWIPAKRSPSVCRPAHWAL